jgi:hypothetical protein
MWIGIKVEYIKEKNIWFIKEGNLVEVVNILVEFINREQEGSIDNNTYYLDIISVGVDSIDEE